MNQNAKIHQRTNNQSSLLRAARIQNNKEIFHLISKSSDHDLNWLLMILQQQYRGTPHIVFDHDMLASSQAWIHQVMQFVEEQQLLRNTRKPFWLKLKDNYFTAIILLVIGAIFTVFIQELWDWLV